MDYSLYDEEEREFWDEYCFDPDDEWECEDGCILGDECLHHDPEHTSDECFDLAYAEEFYREGMRTTEGYKLGASEKYEEILDTINEMIGMTVANSNGVLTLKRLRAALQTKNVNENNTTS